MRVPSLLLERADRSGLVPSDSRSLLETARERVVILDSATGTGIQWLELTPEDFGGLDGCNEYLNIYSDHSREVVRRLHRANLDAGVDAVKTNSFGASAVTLVEYELAERAYEINKAAAELAREVADEYATAEGPRWVAGSMGPGTKLPSLGQVGFDGLHAAYREQARGLLDGGVDVLLVETVYDLLQAKTAIIGAQDALVDAGREVPILVSVTIETTGQMLVGSEIGAALTALEPLGIDALGINCATGPDYMHEHLRYLSAHSRLPIICQPNAGLPRVENDRAAYDLTPSGLTDAHRVFVGEYGVSIIGGCCGTTPAHMAEVVGALRGARPESREPQPEAGVTSLFTPLPYDQDASVLIVGERANANGSRRFKRLLADENFDEMANVVRDQASEGAHIADVCVDYVGRDGVPDMEALVAAACGRTTLPLMLDSTEPPVLEAGLKLIGGKPLVNSINLEDGGERLDRTLRAARRYGAAVVALVIDEEGQARTADRKLAIAHRIHDLAVGEYGLPAEDLFFDMLTLPLGSGQEELRNDGKETLAAIRRIKAEIPGVHTILGVSNVSFGLNAASRQVLNSVFLHAAVEAGLDAAIVNAKQILPEHQIEPEGLLAAQRLIANEWVDGVDPLHAFMAVFSGVTLRSEAPDLSESPVEERLHRRILDGLREGLQADLDEAMQERPALTIVNGLLLPAMQVVGDLFGSGKMQLPFVLQSAETMKAAVAHLEPYMEKSAATDKGTIVLATVRGDVHDIGKNLVDIILSNNGFRTINLGIKQPIANVIEAADAEGADAIGLSGLLVKSTVVMKEDLQELNRRGLASRYPVLLGGAALTRRYVEQDLRNIYEGNVYYGQDAFEGLSIMNALREGRAPDGQERTAAAPAREQGGAVAGDGGVATAVAARSSVATDAPLVRPPFWGRRVHKGIAVREIVPYLNEVALFRGQWGFRKGDQSEAEFEAQLESDARSTLRRLVQEAVADGVLEPSVAYGYFPAQADGDDLIIYEEDQRTERVRFCFPRQAGKQRLCLADYFRPVESGEMDVAGFHVVTMGSRVSERAQSMFAADRYQDYLYWHGFGVEMAEALAEYWHARVRRELGIDGEDGPEKHDLFAGRYWGARFSFGYPACPNLEDQQQLFELLAPEEIGLSLSEEFQLVPEQSTSAIITAHPEARYFNV
jgi:5-methyltetrahydrofolate--homocysteine methyltransferase